MNEGFKGRERGGLGEPVLGLRGAGGVVLRCP